jgi:hypothetical protein
VCLQEGYDGWYWLDSEIEERFNENVIIPDDKLAEEIQVRIESIVRESFADTMASWGVHDLILRVVDLMKAVGMTRDDMFKFYLAKSVLNEFRQNNGYKDGTYPKQWFGKEDNVFMLDEARSIKVSEQFQDELHESLVKALAEVKGSQNGEKSSNEE